MKLPPTTPEAVLDGLMDRKQRTRSVSFAQEPQDAVTLAELRSDVSTAETVHKVRDTEESGAELAKAEKALTKFLKSIESKVWTFKFGSIGLGARAALETRHPASPEQLKEAAEEQRNAVKLGLDDIPRTPVVNDETLANELIAMCMVSVSINGVEAPPLTLDQVNRLFKSPGWTGPDRAMMFAVANSVDLIMSGVDLEALGKG